MKVIIKDLLFYGLARGLPGVAGIAAVIFLTKGMTPDGYGLYALAFTGANAVSILATGWINQAVLRFLPGRTLHGTGLYIAAKKGAIMATIAALLLTSLGLFFTLPSSANKLFVVGIGAMLSAVLAVYAIWTATIQALGRAGLFAVLEFLRASIWLVSLVVLVAFDLLTPARALACVAGAYAVVLVVSFNATDGLSEAPSLKENDISNNESASSEGEGWLLRFWQFGFAMSIWLGVTVSMPFVERVLIERFLGLHVMGTYAALHDVVFRGASVLLTPAVMALHPVIMRNANLQNHRAAAKIVRVSFFSLLAVSVPIVVVITLLSGHIISFLSLPTSIIATNTVAALVAAGCIWQLALLSHKLIEAQQRTKVILGILLMASVLNIILNIFLIPAIGVLGVALASLFSGCVYVAAALLMTTIGQRSHRLVI